jgi:hypothetical protein
MIPEATCCPHPTPEHVESLKFDFLQSQGESVLTFQQWNSLNCLHRTLGCELAQDHLKEVERFADEQ